ncbi:MAG: acyltransferase [Candidatus Electrothrix sp. AX5]|nr:acyltransferase [Candidatus Electrothrix sp. AX5]
MRYQQRWTLKKICCYLFYFFIAKHLPGRDQLSFIGEYSNILRSLVCKPLFLESAKIVRVGRGVDFDNGCFIAMKDHANIGDDCLLGGPCAKIVIGKHVMIGKRCILINQNHTYSSEGFTGKSGEDIIIDDYAWLGHQVTVLAGVRIGCHAIIGAGAVVSKSVPDYAIAVGNPARIVKYRNKPLP